MSEHTDTKFFTNAENNSLYKRFCSTIQDAQYFDVLVGYFYTSGFYRLHQELEKVEKIRILVGLNTNKKTFEIIKKAQQESLDFESHKACREEYSNEVVREIENVEESYDIEMAAKKMIEYIRSGKLDIRAYPNQDLHAKVYITRFHKSDRDYGRVITGSSNFSENGLIAKKEFNVELKDRVDVEFALKRFEELWVEGVDVSQEYIETIENRTWLNNNIMPYDIYLKFLYEYFKEDINVNKDQNLNFPEGFMNLDYQKYAVASAHKMLETYHGVFLADVVGLGKTYITALLLQKFHGMRKLIICPPVLKEYWEDALEKFHVSGHKVESHGKLKDIIEKDVSKYSYIVIDEAHRFRNESTSSYEMLHKICRNKKIILVSATPLNNKLEDIKSQIKLFQPIRNSAIPGVRNLDKFFRERQYDLDRLKKKLKNKFHSAFKKNSKEYLEKVKETSEEVRDKILRHIMIRRTRSEIVAYFKEDIEKQGLHFPKMADPQRLIYQFDSETDNVFNQTIKLLKELSYARYTPLLFLKNYSLSVFDREYQQNLSGFMKSILVKRLESSFYAFKNSLRRFIESYENFIDMYNTGTIWIGKNVDVFELFDDPDGVKHLHSLLDKERVHKYPSKDFKSDYIKKLHNDIEILKKMSSLWAPINHDPKAESFIKSLKENPKLKNKKILIFSEAKETVEYLQRRLDKHFPNKVLSHYSNGGIYQGEKYSKQPLRKIIYENYDPGHENPKDDVKILITTDVLAEGVNLHRSNTIINYDLPWNPTRVLQRVGRVNRVNSQHQEIYVFNIFPTEQSNNELKLEDNIKSKMQAFHSTLGEDSKYLTDDEELSAHQLFEKLTNKNTFTDDKEEMDSELRYLQIIRHIRDKNPKLFEKIRNMPKKARSGRKLPKNLASDKEQLLTFFRKDSLKKFILGDPDAPKELTFLSAAQLFECKPETKKHPIPQNYYNLLEKNKQHFEKITDDENIDMETSRHGGFSNEQHIINAIKICKKYHGFTDDEEKYLYAVKKDIEHGSTPEKTIKDIKQAIGKKFEPLHILSVLKDHIKDSDLDIENSQNPKKDAKREVILSQYLAAGVKK
ncbi:MAG: helicase-related protein [Alphaproteobacteria bacterium]